MTSQVVHTVPYVDQHAVKNVLAEDEKNVMAVATPPIAAPPALERKWTRAEFERFIALPENSERRFELINGEIVEKVPTFKHGLVAGYFVTDFNIYLRVNPIGRVAVEVRHGLLDDDENDRLPDVSYISDRTREVTERGATPYMPDLAIEVKSPDDSMKKLREKARYYLGHGTKIVWIAIPELKVVEVYTADEELVLGVGDTLTGGDVLPGFTMPVANAFEF